MNRMWTRGSVRGGDFRWSRWLPRGPALLAIALVLLGVAAPSAQALPSFGKPSYLNSSAASDDASVDALQDLASDGAGTWVAVWSSDNTLGSTIGADFDILFAVSSDDGVSWSPPAPLNPDAAMDSGDDRYPQVAYVGGGEWVAVWRRLLGASGILTATSIDGGASWGGMGTITSTPVLQMTMESAGATLVVIAETSDDLGGTVGSDSDLIYFRSGDGGSSWSPVSVLNTSAAVDQSDQDDGGPTLATDGAGNWIAIWTLADFGDLSLQQSVSTDDGVSWGGTSDLSSAVGGVDDASPSLKSDGAGRWIVVWSSGDNPPFLAPGTSEDILYSMSENLGSTWSQAQLLNSTAVESDTGFAGAPTIAFGGDGNWIVAWQELGLGSLYGSTGSDIDLFVARSVDGGSNWSDAALLNANGTQDTGFADGGLTLNYEPVAKTWLAAWAAGRPPGTVAGDDFDLLFARSDDHCPSLPAPNCLGTTVPRRSRVKIKNDSGERDSLTWKFARGEETLPADIGDPTASSSFSLCVYDGQSMGVRLVFERAILGGSVCEESPCWSATSSGYKYADKKLENGPIKKMLLRTGVDGKASFKVTAKGAMLGLPILPFEAVSPVRLQLISQDTGVCWDATFALPTSNTAESFKAASD